MQKTYYPIIIPTLNRYNHFRQCVESLSACTHADKTELVIGLDYPPADKYKEGYLIIKEYIPKIKGFKKVTVFEHSQNLGPEGNWNIIMEYAFSKYEALISTEDDNVFSPCFLDYMNKALEKYKDNESILSISGYNHICCHDKALADAFMSYDNTAWGTGYWKHKEAKIRKVLENSNFFADVAKNTKQTKKILSIYPNVYNMLLQMIKKGESWGDVKRTVYNIVTGHYQIKPSFSLVRNMGYDGSGVHCTSVVKEMSCQPISEDSFFNLPDMVMPQGTGVFNKKSLYYLGLSECQDVDHFVNCLFKDHLRLKYSNLYNILEKIKTYGHRYKLGILRRFGYKV